MRSLPKPPWLVLLSLVSLGASFAACSGHGLEGSAPDGGRSPDDVSAEDSPAAEPVEAPASTDARDAAGDADASSPPSRDANGAEAEKDAAPMADGEGDAKTADVLDGADAGGLTMIQFGNLPINSIRWDVWGVDSATGLCVDIVWDFSNTGHKETRHCDDFGPNFPYVFIATGPCDHQPLHYGGNATILSAGGCVEFKTSVPQSVNAVDVTLQVQSPLFNGEIRAHQ